MLLNAGGSAGKKCCSSGVASAWFRLGLVLVAICKGFKTFLKNPSVYSRVKGFTFAALCKGCKYVVHFAAIRKGCKDILCFSCYAQGF